MKLELEQRGRQIKEMEEEVHGYEKLGPQAATVERTRFPWFDYLDS